MFWSGSCHRANCNCHNCIGCPTPLIITWFTAPTSPIFHVFVRIGGNMFVMNMFTSITKTPLWRINNEALLWLRFTKPPIIPSNGRQNPILNTSKWVYFVVSMAAIGNCSRGLWSISIGVPNTFIHTQTHRVLDILNTKTTVAMATGITSRLQQENHLIFWKWIRPQSDRRFGIIRD